MAPELNNLRRGVEDAAKASHWFSRRIEMTLANLASGRRAGTVADLSLAASEAARLHDTLTLLAAEAHRVEASDAA